MGFIRKRALIITKKDAKELNLHKTEAATNAETEAKICTLENHHC